MDDQHPIGLLWAARKRRAKAASNKIGITIGKLGRKYAGTSSYVTKVLKKEGVKCYKRQKASKSSSDLACQQKKCCRAMIRKHCRLSSQTELAIDDDSYSLWKQADGWGELKAATRVQWWLGGQKRGAAEDCSKLHDLSS